MNAKIVGSVMKVPKSTNVKANPIKTPPIINAIVVSRMKIIANHNIPVSYTHLTLPTTPYV